MGQVHCQSRQPSPVLQWAQIYLETERRKWPKGRLAVVFDIDDTAILVKSMPDGKVLKAFRELYNKALSLGYEIYFVTARPDERGNRSYTQAELRKLGFGKYSGLALMPTSFLRHPNYSLYKAEQRRSINDLGRQIVLNLGDTWYDHFLMSPYQTSEPFLKVEQHLTRLPPHNYVVFRPPDPAWMAIKFPERY